MCKSEITNTLKPKAPPEAEGSIWGLLICLIKFLAGTCLLKRRWEKLRRQVFKLTTIWSVRLHSSWINENQREGFEVEGNWWNWKRVSCGVDCRALTLFLFSFLVNYKILVLTIFILNWHPWGLVREIRRLIGFRMKHLHPCNWTIFVIFLNRLIYSIICLHDKYHKLTSFCCRKKKS